MKTVLGNHTVQPRKTDTAHSPEPADKLVAHSEISSTTTTQLVCFDSPNQVQDKKLQKYA